MGVKNSFWKGNVEQVMEAAKSSFRAKRGRNLPIAIATLVCAVMFSFGFPVRMSAQTRRANANTNSDSRTFASATDLATGQAIYEERCAICHFSASTAQKIGPGLKGLYRRAKFANGKAVNDAGVTAWVEKGGKNMPGFKKVLQPEQIRALVVYMRTL